MLEIGFYTPLETGYLLLITRYPDWRVLERYLIVCPDRAALNFWLACNPRVDAMFLSGQRFLECFPNAREDYGLAPRIF